MGKVELGTRIRVETLEGFLGGTVDGISVTYADDGRVSFVMYKVRFDNGVVGDISSDRVRVGSFYDESTSELDAIERDMADLFARMRAAIERLK